MVVMARRDFLARVGALSAVSALAACGGTPATATASPAASGAAATQTPAPTLTKVRLGQVSVSAANSAIWSADEGGYLRLAGLEHGLRDVSVSPYLPLEAESIGAAG